LFAISIQTLLSEEAKAAVQVLEMPGNVLDLAIVGTRVMASIDNIHEPGSMVSVDASTVRFLTI
jgi:hypothetical protein